MKPTMLIRGLIAATLTFASPLASADVPTADTVVTAAEPTGRVELTTTVKANFYKSRVESYACTREVQSGTRTECTSRTRQDCRSVPHDRCQNVNSRECTPTTRRECGTRQECSGGGTVCSTDSVCNSHGCTPVQRCTGSSPTCRSVEDCRDVSDSVCRDVSRQQCGTVYEQECQTVPYQDCREVPVYVTVPHTCTRTVNDFVETRSQTYTRTVNYRFTDALGEDFRETLRFTLRMPDADATNAIACVDRPNCLETQPAVSVAGVGASGKYVVVRGDDAPGGTPGAVSATFTAVPVAKYSNYVKDGIRSMTMSRTSVRAIVGDAADGASLKASLYLMRRRTLASDLTVVQADVPPAALTVKPATRGWQLSIDLGKMGLIAGTNRRSVPGVDKGRYDAILTVTSAEKWLTGVVEGFGGLLPSGLSVTKNALFKVK